MKQDDGKLKFFLQLKHSWQTPLKETPHDWATDIANRKKSLVSPPLPKGKENRGVRGFKAPLFGAMQKHGTDVTHHDVIVTNVGSAYVGAVDGRKSTPESTRTTKTMCETYKSNTDVVYKSTHDTYKLVLSDSYQSVSDKSVDSYMSTSDKSPDNYKSPPALYKNASVSYKSSPGNYKPIPDEYISVTDAQRSIKEGYRIPDYKSLSESYRSLPDSYNKSITEDYKLLPENYKSSSEGYKPLADGYKPTTDAYKSPTEIYKHISDSLKSSPISPSDNYQCSPETSDSFKCSTPPENKLYKCNSHTKCRCPIEAPPPRYENRGDFSKVGRVEDVVAHSWSRATDTPITHVKPPAVENMYELHAPRKTRIHTGKSDCKCGHSQCYTSVSPDSGTSAVRSPTEESYPSTLKSSPLDSSVKSPTTESQMNNMRLQLNGEDEGMKAVKRERNRLAARRCRQNQRDRIGVLERDVRDMESANSLVEKEIELLHDQARQLTNMLMNHKCVLKMSGTNITPNPQSTNTSTKQEHSSTHTR